jgi:hypothetical protein
MNSQDELENKWREEFEIYVLNNDSPRDLQLERYPHSIDDYVDFDTHEAWLAYAKARKKAQEEIDKLKYDLNNSMNYHCENFLSNDSGTVSCQVKKYKYNSYENEIQKRDKLLEQAKSYFVEKDYPTEVEKQWLKEVGELK